MADVGIADIPCTVENRTQARLFKASLTRYPMATVYPGQVGIHSAQMNFGCIMRVTGSPCTMCTGAGDSKSISANHGGLINV